MLKVGLPGAKEGLQARDVTMAQLLKAQGYATAQFGKNHLGDLDEHLPTAHGFDEFFGSLYHLNAEEEFENPDYFKDPALIKRYQTRGVIHTWANADGTQRIESTGPLGKKRMETIDEEITKASLDYLDKAKQAGKPFFLWWNSTRMHVNTHLKPESAGKTGLGVYPDGMVEHDAMVGQLLDKLKALGLEENTIVMYSTDNGAEAFSWPDGGTTPFRGEKATNWEGGYRVPTAIRWPGVIKPGTVNNDMFSHEDMLPTLLAAAGAGDVKAQLLKGMKVGDKTFKVHLDGYNVTDALAGKAASPRHEFFYFNDDGSLVGLRFDTWKIVFAEQRFEGFEVWQEPFVPLRLPKISICARTRSKRPTSRSGTRTGVWTGHFCSCRRSSTSGDSWPRSRSSLRARRSGASASTRSSRRSKRAAEASDDAPARRRRHGGVARGGDVRARRNAPGSNCHSRGGHVVVARNPSVLERGACQEGPHVLRLAGDDGRKPRLCGTSRTHRRVRQRRDVVGRAADVLPDCLRARFASRPWQDSIPSGPPGSHSRASLPVI